MIYPSSVSKAIFNQSPNRRKGVFQFDLLTFAVFAGVEADRHLIDARLALEDFGGKLGFKIEAPGLDRDPIYYLPAEDLIACLHIRQDIVIQDIGHQREQLVRELVPEHCGPAWCAQEA